MRTEQGTIIRRIDYTPPAYSVASIALRFDLDPDQTMVLAVATVNRVSASACDWRLNGDGPELVDLAIDGHHILPSQYSLDNGDLVLSLELLQHLPAQFELAITTRLTPSTNTALMGLYVSNGNFFTQCEAQGFRRITFFPDRPDVMARYSVLLRADRERFPVLLANGNLVAAGAAGAANDSPFASDYAISKHYAISKLSDDGIGKIARAALPPGWHWAYWEDPFPKPSYLFALVAGRLVAQEKSIETMSGRNVLLQVWVEPGNLDKTDHAMNSLVHAIRWDEQRFGLELDLDRFMIVAVSDFNMGAMENKGLNIFNTKYVFANPQIATDLDFANIESVVGHEYFHNWTGNRVTCRDWFQLTLKEGLTVFRDQEFSADLMADAAVDAAAGASARAVKRIEDVRTLRAMQFAEDAGPMAHAIRPDSYQEINNFYTLTVYEKGAEVIRMLQTLVGVAGFRRGMDLYFARHDGQAVTCEDFVDAIAHANNRSLDQFRNWYAHAGTPRLSCRGHYDPQAKTYTLSVEQQLPLARSPDNGPLFHIPLTVGLLRPDGTDLNLNLLHASPVGGTASSSVGSPSIVLDVTERRHDFVFADVAAEPIPSLLRNFSAPVTIDFPYRDDQLAFLAAHDSDAFNRWEATAQLALRSVLRVLDGANAEQAAQTLIGVYRTALDDRSLDPAFLDLLLTLPSEGFIAEQIAVLDPDQLRLARTAIRRALADCLASDWRTLYQRLGAVQAFDTAYSIDAASMGRRALRNCALAWWVASNDVLAYQHAGQQFDTSNNMTDRFAALSVLVQSPAPQRSQVLSDFATEFGSEPLVMDKWFALQASAHRQSGQGPVLDTVRALMKHPSFSARNPNKFRALVGSFCGGNLAEFHATDGSGYAFWVEQVLAVDATNPQVAARLARALERWRKFTPQRQLLMQQALTQVARSNKLSADVNEIVSKALAV